MSKSKLSLRVWLRLLATSNLIEKGLNRFLDKNFDTQLSRFDALSALERNRDGLTMSALSEKLLVTNGNTTSLVRKLIDDGFVEKEQSAHDRRIFTVRITAKGLHFFESMTDAHETALAGYFAGLSKTDLDALLALIERAELSARKNCE